jgi:hypothetical protein
MTGGPVDQMTTGMPPRVTVYRWDDGRSIDSVLTTAELVRLFKPSVQPSEWTGLRPEKQAVFVLWWPGSYVDGTIVYFSPQLRMEQEQVIEVHDRPEPVFLGHHLDVKMLDKHPWLERVRAMLWPFAEDLILPPEQVPEEAWDVFRADLFMDDAAYDAAARLPPNPTDEQLEMWLMGLGAPFHLEPSAPPFEDYPHFTIDLGREKLVGYNAPTGWFLHFERRGQLASQEPSLLDALKTAGTTINRPRLLRASMREAELARIGARWGTPSIDPAHLEPYWLLDKISPLLWPSPRFWAWYESLEEFPSTP